MTLILPDPVALSEPWPNPFAGAGEGIAALERAFGRAKTSGKPLLLVLGGDWCGDSLMFAAVLAHHHVAKYVAEHFELLFVDVGRYTKNLDIAERFGLQLHAAPTVLILSSDGELLNRTTVTELRSARAMGPQGVADWLTRWAELS